MTDWPPIAKRSHDPFGVVSGGTQIRGQQSRSASTPRLRARGRLVGIAEELGLSNNNAEVGSHRLLGTVQLRARKKSAAGR